MTITITWQSTETLRAPEGGDQLEVTVGSIELDLVYREAAEVSCAVTTLPVDDGSPISDHVRRNQDLITIEVCHSDSPGVLATSSTLTTMGAASVITTSETTRAIDAYSAMRELIRRRVLVDVTGLREDLEGYVIESMSSPLESDTSGLFEATLSLREIVRAETQDVEAPSPRVERARRPANRGNQPPAATAAPAATTVSNNPVSRQDSQSVMRAFGYQQLREMGIGS